MHFQVTTAMAQLSVAQTHGTIKAAPTFDPETDAGVLRKAMKGIGVFVCNV